MQGRTNCGGGAGALIAADTITGIVKNGETIVEGSFVQFEQSAAQGAITLGGKYTSTREVQRHVYELEDGKLIAFYANQNISYAEAGSVGCSIFEIGDDHQLYELNYYPATNASADYRVAEVAKGQYILAAAVNNKINVFMVSVANDNVSFTLIGDISGAALAADGYASVCFGFVYCGNNKALVLYRKDGEGFNKVFYRIINTEHGDISQEYSFAVENEFYNIRQSTDYAAQNNIFMWEAVNAGDGRILMKYACATSDDSSVYILLQLTENNTIITLNSLKTSVKTYGFVKVNDNKIITKTAFGVSTNSLYLYVITLYNDTISLTSIPVPVSTFVNGTGYPMYRDVAIYMLNGTEGYMAAALANSGSATTSSMYMYMSIVPIEVNGVGISFGDFTEIVGRNSVPNVAMFNMMGFNSKKQGLIGYGAHSKGSSVTQYAIKVKGLTDVGGTVLPSGDGIVVAPYSVRISGVAASSARSGEEIEVYIPESEG